MSAGGPPVDLPNLDETVVQMPEDMRRDMAEAAASNLYAFNRGVLQYRDLTPGCHGPLCAWHDANQSKYKLTLVPRGHLKTSCITIGKNLQRVVRNVEERIMLGNETSTNAQRFLAAIRGHAETNGIFRALYSHVIPKDTRRSRWSNEELVFNRQGNYPEPTIDSIGMTGAMTSRHYTHLCIDDPISEEAAKSKLVMEDVISRISKLFSLMVDPEHNTLDLVGTRWAFYDVYSYFMDWFKGQLGKFIRAAIEDGRPIWPERFSLEKLALIRDDPLMGEYMFSCLYMNNPRNEAVQNFNVKDLRFWRWAGDRDEDKIVLYDANGQAARIVEMGKLDVTTTVDVRYGEQKLAGDRDAVVTVGCTEEGDAIVLDAWATRGNPLEVVSHLIHTIRRYQPRCIGIQKVGYEMSLKWFLQAACEREGLYANVVPVKPGGAGKPHIKGLQPVAATGHLYILSTQHTLRQELAEYPLGQHDDVADALALQLQLWRGLLSPDRMKRYREYEKRILRVTTDYGIAVHPAAMKAVDEMRPDDRGELPSLEDLGIDEEDLRYGQIRSTMLDV